MQYALLPSAAHSPLLVQGSPIFFGVVTHAPATQLWPEPHTWQASPLFPHAVTEVPAVQPLALQQPAQVAEEQVVLH